MSERPRFRRPAGLDPRVAEEIPGGMDPAVLSQLAHSSAQALVTRARREALEEPQVVQRILTLVETEGIEVVASLWSQAPPESLPGALWRVYALREWVRRDPRTVSERYKLGASREQVADVVAGAAHPPGPDEMIELANAVLSGMFTGELDVALERAGAFARVLATGSALDADWLEDFDPAAASRTTHRAALLQNTAANLARAAAKWRAGKLD